jgi:hypothetical protein
MRGVQSCRDVTFLNQLLACRFIIKRDIRLVRPQLANTRLVRCTVVVTTVAYADARTMTLHNQDEDQHATRSAPTGAALTGVG